MKLTYTEINGYLIPDLALPETDTRAIGKYGELRRQFLREHCPDLFDLMLLEGTPAQPPGRCGRRSPADGGRCHHANGPTAGRGRSSQTGRSAGLDRAHECNQECSRGSGPAGPSVREAQE